MSLLEKLKKQENQEAVSTEMRRTMPQEKEPVDKFKSTGPEARKSLEHDKPSLKQPTKVSTPSISPASAKSERLVQVERILEEDISEVYSKMDREHQLMFKSAGEATARKIENILESVKAQVEKIFELIKAWLRLVPGINKWYVIQESKIKTDKIMKMKSK